MFYLLLIILFRLFFVSFEIAVKCERDERIIELMLSFGGGVVVTEISRGPPTDAPERLYRHEYKGNYFLSFLFMFL